MRGCGFLFPSKDCLLTLGFLPPPLPCCYADAAPTKRLWCKLAVVDLAGSERQRRTANRGARLKEAGCINNSLMTLMQCMETIRWNQKHPTAVQRLVPFRDTKLTRLLPVLCLRVCVGGEWAFCGGGGRGMCAQLPASVPHSQVPLSLTCLPPPLSQENLCGVGSGSTVMIVNVGPAAGDFDETVHALKYGALAKEITIAPSKVDSRYGVDGGSFQSCLASPPPLRLHTATRSP